MKPLSLQTQRLLWRSGFFILFVIIFCETGLVILPFLPGDSLLFAAGTFAAKGDISLGILYLILCVAAVLGDSVNYEVGRFFGPKIAQQEKTRLQQLVF